MNRIARRVSDSLLLKLIDRYLRAGVIVDGELQPSTAGTPQDGPLSPLLANILLDDLDRELEQRGLPFVRYADDFVIFTKSERAAHRVFQSVQRFLTERLRLVVNETKSKVVPWQELEFLGPPFGGLFGASTPNWLPSGSSNKVANATLGSVFAVATFGSG